MLTASQVYTHSRLLLDAYAGIMRPLSAELNMAQTAVDILMFLANNPGYDTAKDICTMRHLKPGIVSFHVEKLVQEGYLERQNVPGDRRKCRLVCTEKAASIIEKGRALQAKFMRQMTKGLEKEQLDTLVTCLETFEKNLSGIAQMQFEEEKK